jgi:hypothetical protein
VAGLSATTLSLISRVPRHDRPAAGPFLPPGLAVAIYRITIVLRDNP